MNKVMLNIETCTVAGKVIQEDWFLFLVSEHWPTREIAPSVWMSLPVADGSGTHGIDGPWVLIADRHIELVCTYGGSDIYQPLGVIKCNHIVNSEYPDLANFEKIIAIIAANLDSINSQVIAHNHSGERNI